MQLVATSIRKPVSVTVGVLLIALFGMISFYRIPIQLTPTVDRPRITVAPFAGKVVKRLRCSAVD